MLLPTPQDLYVDQLLTNVSIGYSNLDYLADRLFPMLPVAQQSGLIQKWKKSHWFRDEAKVRAPATRSEGGSWDLDTRLSYFVPEVSYRVEIPDEHRAAAIDQFNLEAESVNFIMDKLAMRRERNFASQFFTTGVWTSDQVGGTDFTQWSDYGAASPLVDATTYMDTMEVRIGREPNVLVIGKQVWNVLRWHPDLIEAIKYTQRGVLGLDLVASLLGIPRIEVGRSLYTTDPEGTAEASVTYQRSWGKAALWLYVPPTAGIKTPSAGYTVVWNRTGIPNAFQWMKRMRDEERRTDIIEGNSSFQQLQTAPDAGIYMSAAVA